MSVGDNVLYQVNPSFIRAAKIIKENADKTVDLMVFVHPDDYPEFSQQECMTGNGSRKGKKKGADNDQWRYKTDRE